MTGIGKRAEIATLGGGCFWCLQPLFQDLNGVESAVVGYAGGNIPNPSYTLVCTDTTGHAEVVQIAFDPDVVSYTDLLRVFLTVHDPTTLNRQGNDVGTQYRSAILYHSSQQKADAERVIRKIEADDVWHADVVTEVAPFREFYRAEEYHQDYFRKNPDAGYCRAIIAPKVAKFRKTYRERLSA